jgi:RHS repeat-associated protein
VLVAAALAAGTPAAAGASEAHGTGPGPETPLVAGDAQTFGESPLPEVTGDGAFRQPVPIEVPSMHGLEPELGLVYDSQAPNGPAGTGWGLTGDSTIQRLSRWRGAPRMDPSDQFVLDGQRLIPCAIQPAPGISCQTGGTHSTERESFRRITRTADTWLVWDRHGTRSRYESWSGKAAGRTFALAERTNTHGDSVAYHRSCDGDDACYLEEIEYRDAGDAARRTRIHFHYEQRPDPTSQGVGDSLVTVRRRLMTVQVRTSGATRSALALGYRAGSPTQLARVTRYGKDAQLDASGRVTGGTALPPEIFGWPATSVDPIDPTLRPLTGDPAPAAIAGTGPAYTNASQADPVPFTAYFGTTHWLMTDVNGDGRDDYVGVIMDPQSVSQTLRLEVRLSRGDGTFEVKSQTTTWPDRSDISKASMAWRPFYRLVTGDVNGDGRGDVVCVWLDEETGSPQILAEAALGTATGFLQQQGTATTGLTDWSPRARWFLGDADGDGRQDLMGVHGMDPDDEGGFASAELTVARSDGQRFSSVRHTQTGWTFRPRDDPHWFVGDADGDGLSDLMRAESVHTSAGWLARLGTASSNGDGTFALDQKLTQVNFSVPVYNPEFAESAATALPGEMANPGDFDGDGRTDLLLVQPEVHQGDEEWTIYFTTVLSRGREGHELVQQRTAVSPWWLNMWISPSYFHDPAMPNRWLIADHDGDGDSDISIVVPKEHITNTAAWPTTLMVSRLFARGDGTFTDVEFPLTVTPWFFECRDDPGDHCPNGPRDAVLAGDTNGDGRADLAHAGQNVPKQGSGDTRLATLMSPPRPVDHHRWLTTDVTGDGLLDAVYVNFKNPGLQVHTAVGQRGNPVKHVLVRRDVPTAGSFSDPDMRRWIPGELGSVEGGPDGRSDLLHLTYDPAGKVVKTTALLSSGNGDYVAVPASTGAKDDPNTRSFTPVDANGDGLLDLVRISPHGGLAAKSLTLLADGKGGWTPVEKQIDLGFRLQTALRFQALDVDGDGLGDLAQVNVTWLPGGVREERILTLRSDGTGNWKPAEQPLPWGNPGAVGGWRAAELNGDGRADLVRLANPDGLVRVDRATGHGLGAFTTRSQQTSIWTFSPGWTTIDDDADGCDEPAWVEWRGGLSGTNRVRRMANDCSEFTSASSPLAGKAPAALGWQGDDALSSAGEQLVRVVPGPGGEPRLAIIETGVAPRLVRSVSSGLQRTVSIDYRSSAESHATTPSGLAVPVVLRRTTSAPSGGSPAERTYEFEGLRWSYSLQRLLGFRQSDLHEDRRHVTTVYAQSPGCAGVPAEETVRDASEKVRRTTTTTLTDAASSPAPWICHGTAQRVHECDGGQCRDVTSTSAYDDYGNRTRLDELGVEDDRTDDRAKVTLYVANDQDYVVSLPASEQTLDAAGDVVAERRFTYDDNSGHLDPPAIGDVREQADWEPRLDTGFKRGSPWRITRYEHDAHGNVTSETDPSGRTTTVGWDPLHARFPVQRCNALWCTETVYDRVVGRPTTETDANGLATHTTWDALGRHERTDRPDGGCLAHDYLAWGTLSQRIAERRCTKPGGQPLTREHYFDGLHRVYRDDRPGGIVRKRLFRFDSPLIAWESAWGTAGALGPLTRFYYDALDRPVWVQQPDGSGRSYEYGPGSETTIDETSRDRTVRYRDGLGRITRVDQFDGAAPETTWFVHDALDNLVTVVDPLDRRTTRLVGPAGWVWRECDPDRGCVSRMFDRSGLPLTEANAAGEQQQFVHDELGRLTHRRALGPSGAVADEARWIYDQVPRSGETRGHSIGRVVETYRTSSDAREQRWYDAAGNRTTVRTCVEGECVETRTDWDPAGRIERVAYPYDPMGSAPEDVEYGYDDSGRLKTVGDYATFTYRPDDQVSRVEHRNGVVETADYDGQRGWPRKTTFTGLHMSGWGAFSHTLEYSMYDLAGRLTGIDRSFPAFAQRRYHYDGTGRLDQAPLNEVLTYDDAGRPTSRTELGAFGYSDAAHGNAITSTSLGQYAYDAAGRMLSTPTTSGHRWSGFGELLQVTTSTRTVKYRYDADGRRVMRELPGKRYLYGADDLVEARLGAWTDTGPWFQDLHVRSYNGAGRLIGRSYDSGDLRSVQFHHPDRLGSTALISEDTPEYPPQTGSLLELYDYDHFGRSRKVLAQVGLIDDVRFTGAREDLDTGFVHLGARDYDPRLGRFLSPDSIVPDAYEPAAYDRYAYGYNDPLNHRDPSGHAPDPVVEPAKPAAATTPPPEEAAVVAALGQAWPINQTPATPFEQARAFLQALLAPLTASGKGVQVNVSGVACPILCAMAGSFSVGVYLTPVGPRDLLFGEAQTFYGVGGALGGVTPGEKGPELAVGLMGSLGVSVQGFLSESRNFPDFAGVGRGYGGEVGPVSAEVSVSSNGQRTMTFGLGPGMGFGAATYNTWVYPLGQSFWK